MKKKERDTTWFFNYDSVNMPVDYCVSTGKRDDSVAQKEEKLPAETLLALLTSLSPFFLFLVLFIFISRVFFYPPMNSSLIPWSKKRTHCSESHCQRHLIIESRTKTFCDFIWGTAQDRYTEVVPRGNAKAVGNFSRFYFRVRLGFETVWN